MYINEYDKNVLKKYGINIENYKTIREVILASESLEADLDEDELDELDQTLNNLQEIDYYQNYRK